jgi:DNA-binding transcriptional LysR family regulator
MDLRQMRYIIAVADELNFTRAAEKCNVSQPPLSRAIRALEEELGARLFVRDQHHVAVTPAGKSLVLDARKALAILEQGAERARRTELGMTGTLAIGFGGSTVYSLLPALVRSFRQAAPDVDITFRAMSVLHQIDALRDGEIDIGIVRLPISDELIETHAVHTEPLVVALPTGHQLLAHSGPVKMGDLSRSRFVTYEPARGFHVYSDLQGLCRLAGFAPNIAHQVPTTEAVIGIVACGEGIAVVPASAERLRMRGVAFRPLDAGHAPEHLTTVRFALAWRSKTPSAPTAKFIGAIRNLSDSDPMG